MRSLVARLWLLLPLLLLLQASGARSASAWSSEPLSGAYLPDEGAPNWGDPLDERATCESSDDDDSERGREVAHHDSVQTALGWAREPSFAAASYLSGAGPVVLSLRTIRLSASPVRGPPHYVRGRLLTACSGRMHRCSPTWARLAPA